MSPHQLAERIRADHADAARLLEDLGASTSIDPAVEPDEADVRALVRLLGAHLRAVEAVIQPQVETEVRDGALARLQAHDEDRTLLEHLAVLQRARPGTAAFEGALTGIRVELPQHVAAEEELIDRLTAVLGPDPASALGDEFDAARAAALDDEGVAPGPVADATLAAAPDRPAPDREGPAPHEPNPPPAPFGGRP